MFEVFFEEWVFCVQMYVFDGCVVKVWFGVDVGYFFFVLLFIVCLWQKEKFVCQLLLECLFLEIDSLVFGVVVDECNELFEVMVVFEVICIL